MVATSTTETTTIGPTPSITHRTTGTDPQIAYTLFDPDEGASQQRVIFLNGAAHQQNCWQRLAVALAERGVSSISLDYRGHGESTWSQSVQQARLDDDAADVVAVLEAVGLVSSRVILVGHSLGGGVAQRFAEQYEVAGLVMMASLAFGLWMPCARHNLARHLIRHPIVYPQLPRDPSKLFATPRLAREYLLGQKASGDLVQWYLSECWCHESGKALMDMMQARPQPLRTSRVLLLAGQHDPGVPLPWMRRSAALLHAPLLELESPHDLMLPLVSSDWQRAAEAVWSFAQQGEQAQTNRQGASAC